MLSACLLSATIHPDQQVCECKSEGKSVCRTVCSAVYCGTMAAGDYEHKPGGSLKFKGGEGLSKGKKK